MADPTRFVPSFDFSDFAQAQPNTPLPGLQVDVQLDDISASTTSLRDAIIDVRRSDGALHNGIVTLDSMDPDALAAISATTGAADAAASADAAALSASAAATSAAAAAVSEHELETVAALIAANSYYLDDGLITDPATSAFDDGLIV